MVMQLCLAIDHFDVCLATCALDCIKAWTAWVTGQPCNLHLAVAHQIHQALLIMQCCIVLHFLIAFFVQDLFLLLPFWAWRSYCTLPTFYDEGRLMGIFWRLLVATKSCWQVTKAPRRAWIRMEEQAVARSKPQGGRVHQHGCQRFLRLCEASTLGAAASLQQLVDSQRCHKHP